MNTLTKTLCIVTSMAIALFLALVWGGIHVWPETFANWAPLSTRVELTILALVVPLALFLLSRGVMHWRKHQRRRLQDKELQYLLREKQRLSDNWKQLLKQLKKQPGGYNPYTLPWLVMLGDDSAGKSSWLHQAGFEHINFSVNNDENQQSDDVRFWVSEHAVVVELAGHYLEESSHALDTPVLQHLFTLLKRYRPRQPLTGIMVARSARQLIVHQPTWLQEQARLLRRRLRELDTMSGIALPMWLQVTQCDHLEGFQACFNQSCSTERSMPLGIDLPQGYQPEALHKGFATLQETLSSQMTELLHSEKELPERQSLTRFLLQLTLLKERVEIGLSELYGNRHHAPQAWAAGIWLSSSTQTGASYNLLASELGRSWGFHSQRQQSQRLNNSSYFIRNFFPRIALHTLARIPENSAASALWQGKIASAVVLALATLAGGSWVLWENMTYNQYLQTLTTRELNDYSSEVSALGQDADPADMIAPLLRLRDLVETFEQPRSMILNIGLFDHQAASEVRQVYVNQLQQRLFVPLASRSHDTLAAFVHLGNNEVVFNNLLHYLMLYNPEVRQPEHLNNYLAQTLAGREELPEGTEAYLTLLLNDLWTSNLDNFEPDQKLIAQARHDLSQRIDTQLAYDFIRSQPEHSGKVDIRNQLGKNFNSHFQFADGFDGYYLPAIFTREGYQRLDLSANSELINQAVASLARVQGGDISVSLTDRTRISNKVRELYFLDYIRTWKTLTSKITLRSGHSLDEQLNLLETLYQGENPALFDLIGAIADQTQLEPEQDEEVSPNQTQQLLTKQAEKKASKALGLKGASKKIAKSASRNALAKLQKQRTAAIVDETFSAYATFYTDRGEALTEQLDLLYNEMLAIRSHPDTHQAYFDSVVKLANGEGSSLPELQRQANKDRTAAGVWVQQLANGLWKNWLAGAGQYVQQRWQATIWQTWQSRLQNRFPFVNSARQEVRLGDFVEFLRPAGELDQFVTTYLTPFVYSGSETNSHHWQLKPVNGGTLALSPRLLRQLEQADAIRKAYFSTNGDLDINYRLRARRLDSDITSFNLRDDNGNFTYSHGPLRWQERHWPQTSTETLSVNFANSGLQVARNRYTGSWAWQHFLADSQQQQGNSQSQLTYSLKSYDVTLEIELDQRENPFATGLLTSLKLPNQIVAPAKVKAVLAEAAHEA